jgi:N-acetylneuraminate synthase
MNTIESIQKAVAIFKEFKIPYALLHTTNVYPTPARIVRLGSLTEIQNEFPDTVVGLSDHTVSNLACLGAVALGASILERHFTDTKERNGPDIICSMDENECASLIEESKLMKQMRGGKKGPVVEEKPTIDFAYATVVTIKAIDAGETFTIDNIWVKRPGTGEILAEDYEKLLGKKSLNNIPNDTFVSLKDIRK